MQKAKTTLISTLGSQPQIVTFALDHLAVSGQAVLFLGNTPAKREDVVSTPEAAVVPASVVAMGGTPQDVVEKEKNSVYFLMSIHRITYQKIGKTPEFVSEEYLMWGW